MAQKNLRSPETRNSLQYLNDSDLLAASESAITSLRRLNGSGNLTEVSPLATATNGVFDATKSNCPIDPTGTSDNLSPIDWSNIKVSELIPTRDTISVIPASSNSYRTPTSQQEFPGHQVVDASSSLSNDKAGLGGKMKDCEATKSDGLDLSTVKLTMNSRSKGRPIGTTKKNVIGLERTKKVAKETPVRKTKANIAKGTNKI